MEELNDRIAQNKYARMAGLMYLLVIAVFVTGLFLRSGIEKSGNFIDSSHRIASSEHLYRIGVSVQLSTMLLALWLAISLYVALRPANRNLALAALSFRLGEIVLGAMWIVLQFLSVSVHIAADHAGTFNVGLLSELSGLIFQASANSLNVSAIFMGMGSTIFFYLFLRFGYIPRVLSGLGIFASLLVIAACFGKLVFPEYTSILDLAFIPMGLSEVTTGFWLMVKGLNHESPALKA
ncbi:MAG TPA: DUF4386 domain-containing protein [Edaphobacter sp.]|uniref:DUF4386 domain-containing protein n=1 Tax=Edaphobacter sp. TaxID=1934404 RepID=UPI002CD3B5E3|nr:DUF4386 domain-containing protein [Edaphobacter sp.]HUZ94263.1 DUF4386 domain-containing protein [Edaphobacter sp.]